MPARFLPVPCWAFLSTPSARRATRTAGGKSGSSQISIHALREEGDAPKTSSRVGALSFLSTPSARRATLQPIIRLGLQIVISIHALREEGDPRYSPGGWSAEYFYPRPPRGGRLPALYESCLTLDISIHALREEGDDFSHWEEELYQKFLSTPSARRATPNPYTGNEHPIYFYPRPPRGGRHLRRPDDDHDGKFLSTPSARRATHFALPQTRGFTLFLSTPSARRATYPHQFGCGFPAISIHALREEGDDIGPDKHYCINEFLSTPSARRATHRGRSVRPGIRISIHALREEGDTSSKTTFWRAKNFYPRPPRGGRRHPPRRSSRCKPISIHALREEGDLSYWVSSG